MRIQLLSNRYAQALFDLSIENGILEKVQKDIILIDKVLSENRELRVILNNTVLDGYKKIRVLNKIFEGKIETLTLKFLQLITRKGREEYIVYICKAFIGIYKKYKNIMPVTLTTASKLDDKVVKDILKKLKNFRDKEFELTEKIDESLIGGFKLDFEDYQYDDTIRVQLKRLAKEFSDNLYVSKL
jgi:F-type H+-transporting ATPase subunit delta